MGACSSTTEAPPDSSDLNHDQSQTKSKCDNDSVDDVKRQPSFDELKFESPPEEVKTEPENELKVSTLSDDEVMARVEEALNTAEKDQVKQKLLEAFQDVEVLTEREAKFDNPHIYEQLYDLVLKNDAISLDSIADWGETEHEYKTVVMFKDELLRVVALDDGVYSLPRYQELRKLYPKLHSRLDQLPEDVMEAMKATVFVSHRWETPEDPDPDGRQLTNLCQWLESDDASHVRYVWYDFWCLPQAPRSEEDRVEFQWGLNNANWLCLHSVFCPMWSHDYMDRCWCYAEIMWGYDRMLIVNGVNEITDDIRDELHKQYKTLVAKALLEGRNAARQFLSTVLATKRMTNQKDRDPVAQAVLRFSVKDSARWAQMYYRGRFYRVQGNLKRAMRFYVDSFLISARQSNPILQDLSRSIGGVANVARGLNVFKPAMVCQLVHLDMEADLYGGESPQVATATHGLAFIYKKMNRLDDSLYHYQHSYSLCQKLHGETHHETAYVLDSMSGVLQKQKKYEEALEMYQRALKGKKKTLGDTHYSVGVTLNNIAEVLFALEQYESALSICQNALQIKKDKLGPTHHELSVSLSCIGKIYKHLGKLTEARDSFHEAAEIAAVDLGQHPTVAQYLTAEAEVRYELGEYAEALGVFNKARGIEAGLSEPNADKLSSYDDWITKCSSNMES